MAICSPHSGVDRLTRVDAFFTGRGFITARLLSTRVSGGHGNPDLMLRCGLLQDRHIDFGRRKMDGSQDEFDSIKEYAPYLLLAFSAFRPLQKFHGLLEDGDLHVLCL